MSRSTLRVRTTAPSGRWGCLLLAALLLLVVAAESHALDIYWDGGAEPAGFDGTFGTVSNWSPIPNLPDRAPGPDDTAHFDLTADTGFYVQRAYTVSFTSNPTNLALVIEDDWVTFNLGGHVYTTTNTAFPMDIGTVVNRSGRLTITNGAVSAPFESLVTLGTQSGAGFLTVTTAGLLIGSPEVIVGDGGNGTLTVNNNGDIIASDVILGYVVNTIGTATITGGGSSLLAAELNVGQSGTGTLNVTAGGRVDSTSGLVAEEVGSTGAVTVDGANSKWLGSGPLHVGRRGTGTLEVTAGGRLESVFSSIATSEDSMGTVTIDGPGSTWIDSHQVIVGGFGTGALNIVNGGQVQDSEAWIGTGFVTGDDIGAATVNGPDSAWTHSGDLFVGYLGQGTLSVTGGGLVQNANGLVGRQGGTGVVNVDGAGSRWINAGVLTVGNSPRHNAVNITNGGMVQGDTSIVGDENIDRGTIIVSGPDSQFVDTAFFYLGNRGRGTLEITDGGHVSITHVATLGFDPDSFATVTVNGMDSTLTTGNWLIVGKQGAATLYITGGAQVSVPTGVIGLEGLSHGQVIVGGAGSFWDIAGDLWIGGDGVNNGGMGTLRIQAGGTVNVGQKTDLFLNGQLILEGGTLSTLEIDFPLGGGAFQWASGTLHVNVHRGNLQVPNGGVLAPGNLTGLGSTNVFGGYNQQAPGATLEIEFKESGPNLAHEAVFVTDTAVLGGSLKLTLLDGAVPNPASAIRIFDALSISGAFTNVANGQRLLTSDGGGSFVVHYGAGSARDPTQIVLTDFAPAQPSPFRWGDLDESGIAGVVDASLILQWDAFLISEFPGYPGIVSPAFPAAGDVSGDHVLGAVDAAQVLQLDALVITRFPADTNGDGFGPD